MSSISQRIPSGIPVEVLQFASTNTTSLADVAALKVIIRYPAILEAHLCVN